MIANLLATVILCAAPVTKNTYGYAWNGEDNDAYKNAKHVCRNDPHFHDTPCIKSFTKVNIGHYKVVCGRQKDKK